MLYSSRSWWHPTRILEIWRPDTPWQTSRSKLSVAGNRASNHKILATPLSLTCARTRVKCVLAYTNGESHCSQSLAKYLPGSTGSCQLSLKKANPRHSVASEPTEARQTWCMSSVNSMWSAESIARFSVLFLPPSRRLLTQWAEQDYGSSWNDLAVSKFSWDVDPVARKPALHDQTQLWTVGGLSKMSTTWSKVVSWQGLSSAFSLAWCASKQLLT